MVQWRKPRAVLGDLRDRRFSNPFLRRRVEGKHRLVRVRDAASPGSAAVVPDQVSKVP